MRSKYTLMFWKSLLLIPFSLLVLSGFAQQAQDEILLLNGKTLDGKITQVDQAELVLSFKNKKGKDKEIMVENYRVFSYVKDGEEKVLYQQDTVIGNFLTEEEMRYFILGQKDANEGFKANAIKVGSGIVGFGIVTAGSIGEDGSLFGQEPGFLLPVVYPFLTLVINAFTPVRIRLETVSDPAYLSQEYYIVGYEREARAKKIFAGLKGGFVGVVAGFIVYFIAS